MVKVVKDTQFSDLPHLRPPSLLIKAKTMTLDAVTLRNLEIVKTVGDSTKDTLFATLNRTSTAGGSRKLKDWLLRPLHDLKKLNERHEAVRFDRALRRYEDASVLSKTTLSLVNIGQGFIIAFGLTAVMALAGWQIEEGEMTVGGFVMVNTYLLQLFIPLNFLGFVYREIRQSLTDMEAMFKLLDEELEVLDPCNSNFLSVKNGGIIFDDVRFGYDSNREILRGISFTVESGKKVAIVGPSGAGKSTIARLLFRFYDVTEGSIKIDKQDIRQVSQDSLRKVIGIVPQDSVLFNDTIFYNIAYGRPEASPQDCLLYTSPSPRDKRQSRMPSSA